MTRVASGAAAQPSPSPVRPFQPRKPLVLVVDDSEDARRIYSYYLSYRGFQVLTAPAADTAMPSVMAYQPDVIVMDLVLPRLDGISATIRLKQDARTRAIPIILLTGHPHKAIEDGALEAGADVFLTKPCLPEDLERHVRKLRGSSPRRSRRSRA